MVLCAGSLVANGAKVQEDKVDVENGRLIILDNYLFPEDIQGDHSFLQDMYEVLSYLQSGVRVFQHLLGRTNVTKLLKQGTIPITSNCKWSVEEGEYVQVIK